MPTFSARQVGTTALRLLGVSAAEMPLTADMAQSALDALNAMLSGWATEKLLTFTRPRLTLPLVAGQASYTWGLEPGEVTPADISGPPPVRLELCLLNIGGSPAEEWPVTVLNQTQYETGIAIKALQSSYPTYAYLEQSRPYASLHIWPVPDLPYTLMLFPEQEREPYTHWDHVLSWPAGYERCMSFNLAVDLAPQYGIEPPSTILRIAEESKRLIGNVNAEVGSLTMEYGGVLRGSGSGVATDWPAFLRGG
jgi:hypothetical protein